MTARPAFGALVELDPAPGAPQIVFDDIHAWDGYLRGLAGKRVRVVVCRETKGRTLPQNAWLYVIEREISDWSGHTPEEIHEAMLQMHGVRHVITLPGGAQVTVIKRTHELNTEEFTEYVERERAWAANQGLNIPDPGRCA